MIYRKSTISELSNTAGGAFTVLFSIVVTIGLVRILNETAGGRYDSSSILEVVAYSSLINLPPLIALALFLGVLITMNRFWRDSEMYVWFSTGGLSLASFIRPVLKFSLPIVILVAVCSLVISPWSREQVYIYRDRFAQKEDVSKLSPGRFIEARGGERVFFLEDVNQEQKRVRSVFMVQDEKGGSKSLVVADRGRVEEKPNGDRYIVLYDGKRYVTNPRTTNGVHLTDFGTYEMRIDAAPRVGSQNTRVNSMPLPVLMASQDVKAPAEIFWRFSWPLIALNLALLAIPLSYSNPRTLKYYGQSAAVLIFILYLNGISIFQTWITQHKVGVWTGMLGLNLPVTALAVYLFYRLMTLNAKHFDTVIINWLTWPIRALKQRYKRAKGDQR